ncbi:MAG: hypothetical protein HDS12_00500 [Bacteroides sp.]|nr:hypothetical protein [Bacteroides sp.]
MKFITTLLAGLAVAGVANAEYTSPDNGTTFTLQSLSTIEGSGVTVLDNGYLLSEDLTISASDKLQIVSGDKLFIADGVLVNIDGEALFNPEETAYITRATEDAEPAGFILGGKATLENMDIQGGGIMYTGSEAFTVDNCNFTNINGVRSGYGVIVLSGASVGSKITNSTFKDCVPGAINTPANLGINLLIEGCTIQNVSMANELRPFINITSPTEGQLIIRNNTLIGNKLEKPGGIGVSNMLNLPGDNKVLIENNSVKDCSWGLNLIGGMEVRILNNEIIDNCWDPDDNGGIAATLYSLPTYPLDVYAEGNLFQGNKWGPCTIGGTIANFGKTEDPNAEDYNPGNNVFVNNHYTSAAGSLVECDFCNNTANVDYAQGNVWNYAETLEEAARTIFGSNYSSSYGEVIFDPIKTDTGVKVITDKENVKFNGRVEVYTVDGVKVFDGDSASISELPSGTYIITSGRVSQKIVK